MDLTVGPGGPGPGKTLTATIAPANAINKGVTWSSVPAGIVNIVGNGLDVTVNPVAAGTATITVTTADGGFTKACAITVTQTSANVPVTGVSLAPTTMDLAVGGPGQALTATVAPADATNKSVTWGSSPAGIVSIVGSSAAVTVNPVANGTATITVTTADGGKTANCIVTVTGQGGDVPVTGVTLSQTAMNMAPGAAGSLTATIEPAEATNKTVTWGSSNGAVATVADNGLTATVNALTAGTSNITVTTQDGGKIATCAVTVEVPVTGIHFSQGGSLTLTEGDAPATLTAVITPPNATNQNVWWWNSNPSVASISYDGLVATVTPHTVGSTNVQAVAEENSLVALCIVTVNPAGVSADLLAAGYQAVAVNHGGYWAGGVFHMLEFIGEVMSVFVSGGDAYFGGAEKGMMGLPSGDRAKVWRNDELLYSLSDVPSIVHSVCVTPGGAVYSAGANAPSPTDSNRSAVYWVDGGAPITLAATGCAYSIFVVGADVYVAGVSETSGVGTAMLWKGGVPQTLAGAAAGSEARSVFVQGGSVYVAGHVGNRATVWKDGAVLNTLSAVDSSAHSVYVTPGGAVYVAGAENNLATLWTGAAPAALSSIVGSRANSVYVAPDGKVYVGGYETVGSFPHATYWEDGNAQRLASNSSTVNAITMK
jgi:uncharacterized protein YjdB